MQGMRPTRAVLGLDIGAGAGQGGRAEPGRHPILRPFASLACGKTPRAIRARARYGTLCVQVAPRARRAVVGLDEADIIVHRFALPNDLPPAEMEEQAAPAGRPAGRQPPFLSARLPSITYRRRQAGTRRVSGWRLPAWQPSRDLCRTVRLAGLSVAAVDVTAFAIQGAMAGDGRAGRALGRSWTEATGNCALRSIRGARPSFSTASPSAALNWRGASAPHTDCRKATRKRRLRSAALPGGGASRIRESFLKDLARHAARAIQLHLTSRRNAATPREDASVGRRRFAPWRLRCPAE